MTPRPDLLFRNWLDTPLRATERVAPTDSRLPLLVVGAGPAGLAVMTALKEAGVAFEAVESHDGIGGIWNEENPVSAMYDGMRTVTSRFTTHLGTPMPRDWPRFVPQAQARRYLDELAARAGVMPSIALNTRFEGATKTNGSTWRATLSPAAGGTQAQREFRGIVVATGSHNRNHRLSPADLAAEAEAAGIVTLHSADYRSAAAFAGKRVLVVGIGNSGTDIAHKVSAVASSTILAVRTPPWILPSTILGRPGDQVRLSAEALRLPLWYQTAVLKGVSRLTTGNLRRLGLSKPKHGPLDRVPVTDRGIVGAIRSGRVIVRSGVTGFADGVARFADAAQAPEAIDAVIFATGFRRSYPLLPEAGPEGEAIGDVLRFFTFHHREPGLGFMTELVGPRSCWPIFVEQGRAIAAYFAAEQRNGDKAAAFNARRSVGTPGFKGTIFPEADAFHVDYAAYTRTMRALTSWLST